jgi:hypothetical protein
MDSDRGSLVNEQSYDYAQIDRLNSMISLLQQQNQILNAQIGWLKRIRGWLIWLWLGVVFVPGAIGLFILASLA